MCWWMQAQTKTQPIRCERASCGGEERGDGRGEEADDGVRCEHGGGEGEREYVRACMCACASVHRWYSFFFRIVGAL